MAESVAQEPAARGGTISRATIGVCRRGSRSRTPMEGSSVVAYSSRPTAEHYPSHDANLPFGSPHHPPHDPLEQRQLQQQANASSSLAALAKPAVT